MNISAASDRLEKRLLCCSFQDAKAIWEGSQRTGRVCLAGCKLYFNFFGKYVILTNLFSAVLFLTQPLPGHKILLIWTHIMCSHMMSKMKIWQVPFILLSSYSYFCLCFREYLVFCFQIFHLIFKVFKKRTAKGFQNYGDKKREDYCVSSWYLALCFV